MRSIPTLADIRAALAAATEAGRLDRGALRAGMREWERQGGGAAGAVYARHTSEAAARTETLLMPMQEALFASLASIWQIPVKYLRDAANPGAGADPAVRFAWESVWYALILEDEGARRWHGVDPLPEGLDGAALLHYLAQRYAPR